MFEIFCWSFFVIYILFKIYSAIANRGEMEYQSPEQRREEEKSYLQYGITPPSWRRDIEREETFHATGQAPQKR